MSSIFWVFTVCVCFNQPPVWVMCPNHEVVVFQPWKVTATYLVSVYIVKKFSLEPHAPSASNISGYLYITSSSYRSPVSSR